MGYGFQGQGQLSEGSVLAQGTLEQVQNDERVIEVYLGR
jgi:urea transport system ATP-binding protein